MPATLKAIRNHIRKGVKAAVSSKPKERSRVNFLAFKKALWKNYVHTRHHDEIDKKLLEVKRYIETGGKEGIGRLMIWIPPRHGKTQNVNHFVAWLLGEMPHLRVIDTAHGVHLAHKSSRIIRNLISSEKYKAFYPNTKLAKDRKAVTEWDIAEHGGGMIIAGAGGSVTGHGCNLLIVDDPVKGRADAESSTIRQKIKDWYVNDILTRVEEPGGAIIIIQTRWHMDDLSGWILNSSDDEESEELAAEKWAVLNLPALAEENDPLGREPGEALWSEKFNKQRLNRIRKTQGEYAFSAIYQQHPVPSAGGLFDMTNITVIPRNQVPPLLHVCRFYDLAITTGKRSDYTVGVKMGISQDMKLYVLDVWRVRKEFPDVEKGIKLNSRLDGRGVKIRLESEKAGLIALQKMMRDPDFIGHTIDAKPPQGDKRARAGPFAARVNVGMVFIVDAKWNKEWIDELALFDKGPHDDMVDASSGAFDLLAELVRTGGDPVDLDKLLGEVYRI